MGIMKLLEMMGCPTTLPTGHEIGCSCSECEAYGVARADVMRERVRAGKEPETLGEMLMWRQVARAVEEGLRALSREPQEEDTCPNK